MYLTDEQVLATVDKVAEMCQTIKDYKRIVDAARDVEFHVPPIDPDADPEFAKAITVLEFALEDAGLRRDA